MRIHKQQYLQLRKRYCNEESSSNRNAFKINNLIGLKRHEDLWENEDQHVTINFIIWHKMFSTNHICVPNKREKDNRTIKTMENYKEQ